MTYLVGDLVLSGGEKVGIEYSDGSKSEAVYVDSFGYNHIFKTQNGKEIKLSNHFMHLKGIKIFLIE
ncbi:MAG: hypothetical protein RR057_03335 [Clostridia bacterium]